MIRSIAAVVVSYIVMVVLILGLFMGMWFGLGPDGLLKPGSYQGNMLICVAAPSITVACGLLGGWLCATIARGSRPVAVLAALVLGFGMLSAYFTLQKPFPADPRPAGMTVQQIMEVGREPTWIAIFNPIGGAAAVLVGGLVLGRGRREK